MDLAQREKIVHLLFEAFQISEEKWGDVHVKDVAAHLIANGVSLLPPEQQKNEPLKLAELKQMQGEPVWVRDQGGKGIPVCGIVDKNCIQFASGSVVWLDENAGDVKCGSWWFAYRHKPEEK